MSTKIGRIALGLILLSASLGYGREVSQELSTGFNYKNLDVKEAKFEEYRVIPQGLYINEYRLGVTDSKERWSLKVKKPLLDDQFTQFLYERDKGVKFNGWWDKTPHLISLFSKTPYSEAAKGVFTLPDEIQRNIQGQASASAGNVLLLDLASNTRDVPLKLLRNAYGFDISLPSGDNVNLHIGAKQEQKSGTKAMGASFGFGGISLAGVPAGVGPIELPEPVDYITSNMNVGSSISHGKLYASADYNYSVFNNRVTKVTWDSPERLTDTTAANAYYNGQGSSQGRLSLYPDNQQHQANIIGAVDLPLKSRFTASFGYGLTTQSDAFLPYTINTSIVPGILPGVNNPPVVASDLSSLPTSKLGGKVVTWTHSYILNSQPIQPLGVRLQYRNNQTNNKTNQITFPGQTRLDQVWEAIEQTNKPYGNHKQNIDADVSYDVLPKMTVGAGYGLEINDRTFREVEKSKENILRGSIGFKPSQKLWVRTEYLKGIRKMDDFNLDDYKNSAGAFVTPPGLRRMDVTDRDRDRVSGTIQTMLFGGIWMNLSGRYQTEDYKPGKGDLTGGSATRANQQYGVLSGRNEGGTASFDIPILSSLGISLLYDIQLAKFRELSNTSGLTQLVANDWRATTQDLFHTIGADVEYTPTEKLNTNLSYSLSLGKGKIKLTDRTGTAAVETSPPDTKSALQQIAVRSEYSVGAGLALVGSYGIDIFNVTDFAVGDVPIVGGLTATGTANPSALFLGDSLKDYVGQVAYLGIKYKW